MILFAAILPPRAALDAAMDVLRQAGETPSDDPVDPRPRRRLGRRASAPSAPTPVADAVVCLPPEFIHLVVARFGNLTSGDVGGLRRALTVAGRTWPSPTVRIAGGTVLETSGSHSMAVTLAGEVEELASISREVKASAQRLGLFLDRRDFTPALAVVPLADATTGPSGKAALAALADFEGEAWTADHISLVRNVSDSAPPHELARVPLGP